MQQIHITPDCQIILLDGSCPRPPYKGVSFVDGNRFGLVNCKGIIECFTFENFKVGTKELLCEFQNFNNNLNTEMKEFFIANPTDGKAEVKTLCLAPKNLQFAGAQAVSQQTIIDAILAANPTANTALNWQLQQLYISIYAEGNFVTDCVTGVKSEVTECQNIDYECNGKTQTLNPGSHIPVGGDALDTDNDGESDNTITTFGIKIPLNQAIHVNACICVADAAEEGGEGEG